MNTDPIADLLTRIRNASRAHHEKVSVPHSKLKENIARVLKEKGFIEDYKSESDKFKNLIITLKEDKSDLTIKPSENKPSNTAVKVLLSKSKFSISNNSIFLRFDYRTNIHKKSITFSNTLKKD